MALLKRMTELPSSLAGPDHFSPTASPLSLHAHMLLTATLLLVTITNIRLSYRVGKPILFPPAQLCKRAERGKEMTGIRARVAKSQSQSPFQQRIQTKPAIAKGPRIYWQRCIASSNLPAVHSQHAERAPRRRFANAMGKTCTGSAHTVTKKKPNQKIQAGDIIDPPLFFFLALVFGLAAD
jgi:hypothetical protein